uniref:Uncharacterized protein n=1 Tax=Meloidogyne enterolobii TaxID=390850 RepID=A0A6V7WJQ9_MELEN|nr:unnamed protein product [Meloidogyne enterolobii]
MWRRMWGWLLWFICANNCKLWMRLWMWKIRTNWRKLKSNLSLFLVERAY